MAKTLYLVCSTTFDPKSETVFPSWHFDDEDKTSLTKVEGAPGKGETMSIHQVFENVPDDLAKFLMRDGRVPYVVSIYPDNCFIVKPVVLDSAETRNAYYHR